MYRKVTIVLLACMLSACGLTQTQKKWVAIGVGVVGTGLILAHEADKGGGALSPIESGKNGGKNLPWQCSVPKDCK